MSAVTDNVIDLGRLRRTCAACGLQQLCLPAGIDPDALNRLDSVVQNRRPLEKNQALFENGAPFLSLFVVRSGSFKTVVEDAAGESQVVGFHLPGEILGFDAVSNDTHRCAAIALEPSTVCEVPYAHLNRIAGQVPELQRQLHRVISREVVRDHEHLVMMGRRQAMQRLASFIKSLSDRCARLRRDPMQVNLSMSRYELASYLGLVVETVSRLFTRLQNDGVLDVQRKTLRILDMAALSAACDEAPDDRVGDKRSRA
jgi:CRP/FNR family transcriptional regulator